MSLPATKRRMSRQRAWAGLLAFGVLAFAAAPLSAQTGFPFSDDEALHYSINWASGLSLGDLSLTAHRTPSGWNFGASLAAAVPGFAIADQYHSKVTGNDFCSTEFERDLSHGGKHTIDKIVFDPAHSTARRTTTLPEGGGKSDFDTSSCPHDILAYLYLTRREMGQGRMPSAQQVYFGSGYSVNAEYTGEEDLTSPATGKKPAPTDKVVVSVKGPKSDFNFEIYFARDPQRTPLFVRIPSSLGIVTLGLAR